MRYPPIVNELFKVNRWNLAKKLKPGSLVIIHSADPLRLSGDGVLPFRQDSNFFYLTGIDQEDSILISVHGVCPGCREKQEFKPGGRFQPGRKLECGNCRKDLVLEATS